MKSVEEQLEIIKRGTVEIIQLEELKKKLENCLKTKKPLIVKAGFDPSAPDIHLGHTVLLRKMKHFQLLGHEVIFLIGDFTGRIGDPSEQSQTRKQLTKKEVLENAGTYERQIFRILDKKKTKIVFNSKWCDKMKIEDVLALTGKYTVARMLERDDFLKRYKNDKPITMLEFLYPLIQGYDSVVLKADIELGGTDQKFNLLVGRNLQRDFKQAPQVVITMPLLEGTDGVEKMSKSLGNYIGIEEDPKEIFGKIMSISDELMLRYYELLTDESLSRLKSDLKSGALHPKDAKKKLAKIIIGHYYDSEEADAAEANFEKAFKHGEFPDNVGLKKLRLPGKKSDIVTCLSMVTRQSKGEMRRKLLEGAVEVNGKKEKSPAACLCTDTEYKIRIGKRFFRILFEE
ncbi:MAG: tyrosine--tRNA ligase [Candidatus Omnitrophota bacterium]|nr:MAG: tyrosine--tRNA ligase [Candidatus Omnitrophota bacterium]